MYEWLKIIHIISVIIWMGGMLTAPLVGTMLSDQRADQQLRLRLRSAFSRWITPAMILSLIVGIALAQIGGWFTDPWLLTKLVLVLVMTALHGVISGRLRRFASDPKAELAAWFPRVSLIVLLLLAAVVSLVVTKTLFAG
ncbi:CopD family protein [Ahrensia marina]|uniref:CopD family protein n=1 Tax=Ahrensia marina TaxID=1514904 RepID=UPI0035D10E41